MKQLKLQDEEAITYILL